MLHALDVPLDEQSVHVSRGFVLIRCVWMYVSRGLCIVIVLPSVTVRRVRVRTLVTVTSSVGTHDISDAGWSALVTPKVLLH